MENYSKKKILFNQWDAHHSRSKSTYVINSNLFNIEFIASHHC